MIRAIPVSIRRAVTIASVVVVAVAAGRHVDRDRMVWIKLGLAAVGTLLLAWGAASRDRDRPDPWAGVRDGLLAATGVLALLCWWNLGRFHFDEHVHRWDQFHYYLGAKYHAELGHTRLYECVSVADVESGMLDAVRQRRIRDLATNELKGTAELLADAGRCKRSFSAERWDAFSRDVAFFRGTFSPPRWEALLRDHGYNATPVWGLVGSLLTRLAPASGTTLLMLSLLDPLLLAAMWGAVLWAFGWRAACVALLWWGTNDPGSFAWTGGGFLRQDWLALTVIGIGLVRRGHDALGGAALTWAMLLRIFPGLLVGGLVLKVLVRMARERRFVLTPAQTRFTVGCLVALGAGIGLSSWYHGTWAWGAFIENSRASLRSAGTNTVGLMTVLAYDDDLRLDRVEVDPSGAAMQRWLDGKRDVFRQRRALFWPLLLAFVVVLALAVRDEPDWSALVLGLGLVPIATFVYSYYYSILLGYGLLTERRGESVGALLSATAALTGIGALLWPRRIEYDQRFGWDSLAIVLLAVAVTALSARRAGRRPA